MIPYILVLAGGYLVGNSMKDSYEEGGIMDDSVLKNIADKVASNLYCDRFGSCVHFAEIFVEAV